MSNMTDAMDLFIMERIGAALEINNHDNNKLYEQSEEVLATLSEEHREIMRDFIQSIYDQMAKEEILLYRAGFRDGIYIIKLIDRRDGD